MRTGSPSFERLLGAATVYLPKFGLQPVSCALLLKTIPATDCSSIDSANLGRKMAARLASVKACWFKPRLPSVEEWQSG
jgi:hypothetical protein